MEIAIQTPKRTTLTANTAPAQSTSMNVTINNNMASLPFEKSLGHVVPGDSRADAKNLSGTLSGFGSSSGPYNRLPAKLRDVVALVSIHVPLRGTTIDRIV
jgi:hypothetical protein